MMFRKYFDFSTYFSLLTIILLFIGINAYFSGQIRFNRSMPLVDSAIMDVQVDNMAIVYQTLSPDVLNQLLMNLSKEKKVYGYLINSKGQVFGTRPIPANVTAIARALKVRQLPRVAFKREQLLISKEVKITNNQFIRLVVDINSMRALKENRWLFTLLKIRFVSAFIISLILSVFLTIFIKYRISKSFPIIDKISKGNFVKGIPLQNTKTNTSVDLLNEKLHDMSQKIQAMMDSKDRLLMDISHELRSPLSRQEIAIDIAKFKINSLEASFLERIELENHKLQALINEILAFSKETHSEYQLLLEPFSLTELMQEMSDDAKFEFPNAQIIFEASQPFQITADPSLLYRGLENVIRNALKHANKNNPKVSMSLSMVNQQYEITIKDNGPGVLEHNLELIFSPFYREERQLDMRKVGYGLGLSITKEVITSHGGTIRARNLTPNGLEITITLAISPN